MPPAPAPPGRGEPGRAAGETARQVGDPGPPAGDGRQVGPPIGGRDEVGDAMLQWGDAAFSGTLAWAYLVVVGLSWVLLGAMVGAWGRRWRMEPRVPGDGLSLGDVSIVVCADRSDPLLAGCLQSARSAAPDVEILVVAEEQDPPAALPDGVRWIRNVKAPAPWSTRAWCCLRGAAEAAGSWLLFLDTDAWLQPGGLQAAQDHARRHRLALLHAWGGLGSLPAREAGVVWMRGWLVRASLPMEAIARRADPEAYAAPGFVLVQREAYDQVGGHGVQPDALLADLEMARAVAREGFGVCTVLAPDAWSLQGRGRRWFDRRGAVVAWLELGRNPVRVVGLALFALVGVALPWLLAGLPRFSGLIEGTGPSLRLLAGAICAAQLALGTWMAALDGMPRRRGLLLPVGLVLAVAELAWGMLADEVTWGGRVYRDGRVAGADGPTSD